MERTIFEQDHDDFRKTIRKFLETEVAPNVPAWEEAGILPKDIYLRFGDLGLAGLNVPEEYGGGGVSDFRFNAVVIEETALTLSTLGGLGLHTNVATPYYLHCANEEQKQRWLPDIAAGRKMCSIAMTEPGADRTCPASRPRPCVRATTGSSTVPRRSSPAGSTPIW